MLTKEKYSDADKLVIENLYSELRLMMKEYTDKENFMLAMDYSNNIDFIRIIRSNPSVLFKRTDKYSKLVISLASLRGKILQTRRRLEFYGELFPLEEDDIRGPDSFDEEVDEKHLSLHPIDSAFDPKEGLDQRMLRGLSADDDEGPYASGLVGVQVQPPQGSVISNSSRSNVLSSSSSTTTDLEGLEARLSLKWVESMDVMKKRGALTPIWLVR